MEQKKNFQRLIESNSAINLNVLDDQLFAVQFY